ncbi:carotenoid cleavage dioxygenase [Verticillium alfalfae VaMs.102]|uniref:Carotenoid cleavage dioxygenase n=1 Tax=Verticillium alfalfae (strain VaMs.102 / ATCC MYA-4576 / FGSC 10136) TaxID=526221 RepID=C9SQ31_VERA1|nr:carotenoid cleavage dioxygenase [Verticillium alfalfae VaMs.102]EEY20956.1 carotenoid cleavage dioxygenase [Verticillium alfalfae VaMs.102]
MHSFFLTPSYVVLCIPVAHFGLAGLKVPWNRNLLDSIEAFDATQRCKWLVVDRRGKRGLVASFDTPAAFFFHSVNSFEETSPDGSGVDLFCDVVEYPNQDVIRSFNYDVLLDRNDAAKRFWGEKNRLQTLHPRLARYRLGVPLTSGRKRGQRTRRRGARCSGGVRGGTHQARPSLCRARARGRWRTRRRVL